MLTFLTHSAILQASVWEGEGINYGVSMPITDEVEITTMAFLNLRLF